MSAGTALIVYHGCDVTTRDDLVSGRLKHQISLRDNRCVIGWFLPSGAELLTEQQYAEAKARLVAAQAAYKKPRVRVNQESPHR